MKIKKLSFLIYFLIFSFSYIYSEHDSKSVNHFNNSKIENLSKISSIEANDQNFLKICQFIESNWENLMNSSKTNNTYYLITFDKSFITIHPEALEVCIFFETHTKNLGAGYFKRVIKGLAYNREKEVAIAFPKGSLIDQYYQVNMNQVNTNIEKKNSIDWDKTSLDWNYSLTSSEFDSSYMSFNDWWTSYDFSKFPSHNYFFPNSTNFYDSSDFYDSFDFFDSYDFLFDFDSSDINMENKNDISSLQFFNLFDKKFKEQQELNEIKMLMKAQNCSGTTKLFFISFPETSQRDQSPIIVQQYYNGGALGEYIYKRALSNDEKLLVFHDTLMALSDIHDQNIVHHDLHFGNILVQENIFTKKIDEVVIGDFGISVEVDPNHNFINNQKKHDLNYLLTNLIRAFYFQDDSINHFIEELLIQNEITDSTRNIYDFFVQEVKNIVSEEEFRYITKNATQKRSLKFKNGRTLLWD